MSEQAAVQRRLGGREARRALRAQPIAPRAVKTKAPPPAAEPPPEAAPASDTQGPVPPPGSSERG